MRDQGNRDQGPGDQGTGEQTLVEQTLVEPGTDIAIVGVSGRFPGAADVGELWANICAGQSGITRFTDEELRASGVAEELLADPNYVKAGAVIDGIDLFDATFFGVGPTEARVLDPQQRLFLEHSWMALEDAGCDPTRLDGTVGVFGGSAWSSYLQNNVAPSGMGAVLGELVVGLANDKDSLATRVAHTLGLTGPAFGVQSYCSTSLVAVCTAASSLAGMECDVALAGGVAVSVPQRVGYLYQPGGIAPPDGECRAFDAAGMGAPLGSGVGVVVMRRLEDALADGDRIYSVLRGWAVNNDGGRKVGFTAPGVRGQSAVIAEALSSADLVPAEIDYVEAHGTGTALGDAAELAALQQVFRGESCLIGSIKTNVGHLDRAAGVTGLIKAALALRNEEIPPTRGLNTLNPQLKVGAAHLEVVTELTPWPRRDDHPRRAGVSAFGVGGTNSHVVLEEAPPRLRTGSAGTGSAGTGSAGRPELLVWSARDAEAAQTMTDRLSVHLGTGTDPLPDVAFTLQTGRRVFDHRRMLVAATTDSAVAELEGAGVRARTESCLDRGVAFLIAGTGEQYPGMAADLYATEPGFARVLDECRAILTDKLGFDPLQDMLAPRDPGSTGPGLGWLLGRETPADSDAGAGQATDHLQPATFAVEYALARLLISWGIKPTVMVGYSLGEYVAATLSGALSLDSALALVVRRAQLISTMPRGAMAAVPLSAVEVRERITRSGLAGVDIAAVNGPKLTVIAGPPEQLDRFAALLRDEAVPCRALATSHAFHSRMLEPVRAELTAWVADNITPGKVRMPYVSNVTGTLITAAQLADPGYWAEHMCAPVRFDTALETLLGQGELAVVEVGPGQSLGATLRGRADCPRERWSLVVPSLPGASESTQASTVLIQAVGRLWLAGVSIDWTAFQSGRQVAKVGLPGYPLRRERYWIDALSTPPGQPALAVAAGAGSGAGAGEQGVPAVAADLQVPTGLRPGHVRLFQPQWVPADFASERAGDDRIIILGDPAGLGVALADALRAEGRQVHVESGAGSAAGAASAVAAGLAGPSPAVLVELRMLDRPGGRIDGPAAVLPSAALLDAAGQSGAATTRAVLVTRGGQAVRETDRPEPEQAAGAVLAVVANQEYLNLTCRTVDLDPDGQPADAVSALVGELTRASTAVLVAQRGGQRFVRTFGETSEGDPSEARRSAGELSEAAAADGLIAAGATRTSEVVSIRRGGTYLITGGVGDVGLLIAEHLARAGARRLVLTSRRGVPATAQDQPGPVRAALGRIRGLGTDVETPAVDVTDAAAMAALVAGIVSDGGALNGVVHAAAQTGPETFRVMRDLDDETIAVHFHAKVAGAQVLEDILVGLPTAQSPDFCVLFSSTSSILGGLAFGSYSAANAALTAIAQRNARPAPGGTRWLAMAWDTWACTLDRMEGGVGAAMLAHSMSTEEGLDAFDRALRTPGASLVITAGGWDDRLPALTAVPELAALSSQGQRHPRPDLAQPYSPPLTATERTLAQLWSEVLGIEPVGARDNFFDLSGNSLLALQMLALVRQRMGLTVPSVALFEAPTVHALALLLDKSAPPAPRTSPPQTRQPQPARAEHNTHADGDDRIAIVGMAGRFPGAGDIDTFWRNLCDGVESISFFSPEELIASGVDPELVRDPAYVPARPVLDDVSGFDAQFFGLSPRMAALTDPQQRLFMEVCWEALEASGYAVPGDDRVGVFGGTNLSTYLLQMPPQMFTDQDISTYEIIMGNEKDALTTQVSYLFDLRGPSVAVQTFCSTSLVATHLAVQSLRHGDCELALAGGVSIRVPDRIGHRFAPGGMESPDGHVRSFDAQARGSMFGDGAAVVVLKRLSDAVRDGDHIWSVIRGSAMNNDGALKVGYTAPSVVGQARVIADAMADAGVTAEDISYIEAHGTATELGDPIEVAALTRAFGPTKATQYCPIGSVKSNVGHLDRAAGVTGLIKTSMALRDGVIPATLHYTSPNPDIDFENGPFYVNASLAPWTTRDGRAPIAGVSSLGMGGTNAHVIVEQAMARNSGNREGFDPDAEPGRGAAGPIGRRYQVVPISARTSAALEQAGTRLAEHLAAHPGLRLADVAYTLQVGRRTFEHRRVVVADTCAEAGQVLLGSGSPSRVDAARGRPVAFVLPDSVATQAIPVAQLYQREPVFRSALRECGQLLGGADAGVDVIGTLTRGDECESGAVAGAGAPVRSRLATAETFALQYALARTLISWGIAPDVLVGYGAGECVAACLAGVLSLDEALALVVRRESLPAEALTQWAGSNLSPQPAVLAYLSGVTGEIAEAGMVADPTYWTRQREAGMPSAGARDVLTGDELVVVELTAAAESGSESTSVSQDPEVGGPLVVRLLPEPAESRSDDLALAEALAQLWLFGVDVDWAAHHNRRRDDDIQPVEPADLPGRVPLPTYPFQRSRYWIDAPARTQPAPSDANAPLAPADLFEAITALPKLAEQDWLYLPVWRQSAAPPPAEEQPGSWLVFTREGTSEQAVAALQQTGADVSLVRPGPRYTSTEAGYTVRPGNAADILAMLRDLQTTGRALQRVVHLWTLDPASGRNLASGADPAASLGLHTLVALAQAAAESGAKEWELDVAVTGTQEVLPGEVSRPDAALATGPCLVIPLEYPGVTARLIDLATEPTPAALGDLVAELRRVPEQRCVALRHGRRWLPGHERMDLPGTSPNVPLREEGVYLITGGLGGIALGMSEQLARGMRAKLVLLGRRGLPPRSSWAEIVAGGAAAQGLDADTRQRVGRICELLELGAEVEIVVGDVADPADVARAVHTAVERFGALHGVIHAAGVPGIGLMQFKRAEDMDLVLAPKVAGTLALAQALRIGTPEEIELDFLVLFSSITTATGGGPGQVDYCAANAFLDGWGQQLAATGRRVLTIDWGEWTWNAWEGGLAGYDDSLQEFFRTNRARVGIGFEEGWRCLVRALASGEPRVVVSTQDFPTMVRGSALFTVDAVRPPADDGPRHPRPELSTMYQQASGRVEVAVARAWCDALRLEDVGVADNFFELGGNSLLGVGIVTTLRQEFELADLAPHILYEAPTVAALATVIAAAAAGESGQPAAGEDSASSSHVRAQLRRSGLVTSAARRRSR